MQFPQTHVNLIIVLLPQEGVANMQIFNTSLALGIIHGMNTRGRAINLLMAQLSSGNRLVSASVDPAGMAIATKMRAQIRGLEQATRNSQDAVSLIQTAEGSLSTVSEMLLRIKELTVQASNDSNTENERQNIQMEIGQLLEEINKISENTEFNKKKLLNGSASQANGGLYFQTGANAGQGMEIHINQMNTTFLGLDGYDVTGKTGDQISAMLDTIDAAIDKNSSERSRLGAYENRLGYTIRNLENMTVNLSDAHSRIADMDMAKGMMELMRMQVLQQASMSMLAMMYDHQKRMIDILFSSLK